MKILLAHMAILAIIASVLARDNGQWGDHPANVRQWFQSLMQPDNPYMWCCGEADAFEANTFEVEDDHYIAVVTDQQSGFRQFASDYAAGDDVALHPAGHLAVAAED
jgi:hypothetical protein